MSISSTLSIFRSCLVLHPQPRANHVLPFLFLPQIPSTITTTSTLIHHLAATTSSPVREEGGAWVLRLEAEADWGWVDVGLEDRSRGVAVSVVVARLWDRRSGIVAMLVVVGSLVGVQIAGLSGCGGGWDLGFGQSRKPSPPEPENSTASRKPCLL